MTQETTGGTITLQEDLKSLNEVVVIGYGTQRKGDVTSAVSSVKAEDFTAGKIGDAAELVKGKIAGLSVTNSSGDPISVTTHCMEVGHALGDFWGLKSVGVDKDGIVLVEVKDNSGNWVVKPFTPSYNVLENRQRLGNGMPQVYLGWGHQFRYKDFDLSMQFTGQFGYKILNAQRCNP